jgi:hypothetical protein
MDIRAILESRGVTAAELKTGEGELWPSVMRGVATYLYGATDEGVREVLRGLSDAQLFWAFHDFVTHEKLDWIPSAGEVLGSDRVEGLYDLSVEVTHASPRPGLTRSRLMGGIWAGARRLKGLLRRLEEVDFPRWPGLPPIELWRDAFGAARRGFGAPE